MCCPAGADGSLIQRHLDIKMFNKRLAHSLSFCVCARLRMCVTHVLHLQRMTCVVDTRSCLDQMLLCGYAYCMLIKQAFDVTL